MNTWKHEWRGHSYYSHGSNDRRGVITLIGAKLEFHLFRNIIDSEGRYIITHCKIQESPFLLVNIYAPNVEADQVRFF